MDQDKLIEDALNELIEEAVRNGGHLYIVDKKRNNFALRLTDPITIHFYGGFKEAKND